MKIAFNKLKHKLKKQTTKFKKDLKWWAPFYWMKGYFLDSHLEKVNPHIVVEDLSWINWKSLKRYGYDKIIIDKENTLTKFKGVWFYNKWI